MGQTRHVGTKVFEDLLVVSHIIIHNDSKTWIAHFDYRNVLMRATHVPKVSDHSWDSVSSSYKDSNVTLEKTHHSADPDRNAPKAEEATESRHEATQAPSHPAPSSHGHSHPDQPHETAPALPYPHRP